MLFQFYGGRFGGASNFLYYLDLWGIRDIILPFLLFFTVLFAVLQKIKLFGPGNEAKKYNVVLSLVIAALVVIPHITGYYPAGKDIVVIVNNAIPQVALLLVVIVMLLLMLGLIAGRPFIGEGIIPGGLAVLGALILVGIFVSEISPVPLLSALDPSLKALIVVLLVFGLIVWFVSRPEKTQAGREYWEKKSIMDILLGPHPPKEGEEGRPH